MTRRARGHEPDLAEKLSDLIYEEREDGTDLREILSALQWEVARVRKELED
jgi:hypothetical protein